MELDQLKRSLQDHFRDGLLVVVGSGLSAAEGIPGMGGLSDHLLAAVSPHVEEEDAPLWQNIKIGLASGNGLEDVLLAHPPSARLEERIVAETGCFIEAHETSVISEVVRGSRTLRFSRLLRHLLRSDGIPVVTPNYDRLIEVAVEDAGLGLGIDTMFAGHTIGLLDEGESRMNLCREFRSLPGGRGGRLVYKPRVILCKPHGSLDWYLKDGKPIRYAGNLPLRRLLITPGSNKYLNGYERPFDRHRERANAAIDSASRFLVLGYGFNDQHLETHLTPAIRSGRPTLILTFSLSLKAQELAITCDNVTAIDSLGDGGAEGSRIFSLRKEHILPNRLWWDLHKLIDEVLT
ncbi:SIR2 family protein [Azospirillum sp. TSO5]|uniref:SIR2 family protein n=1 Tax=Azospirillum sp. TSO5 TaxID=716760 RepID=UPI000D64C72A|nr:SIR2 family protein [Azospirillum sp. TSO5]